MRDLIKFTDRIVKEVKKDNLPSMANEITYKLLLAIFPFIIFAFSILGFLELDSRMILDTVNETLPDQAMDIINIFIVEVIASKNSGVLSTSLIVSIISSSSGFLTVINCLNRAYGFQDRRNLIVKYLIAVLLVFAFVLAMAVSILSLVFSDSIKKLLLTRELVSENFLNYIFGFSTYLIAMLILLLIVIMIFKLASSKYISIFSVMPGAVICVVMWFISSKIFNVYINNFSKYSKVYGSIGSIFVLMLWLNLISFFLLLGGEINAVLQKYDYEFKKVVALKRSIK